MKKKISKWYHPDYFRKNFREMQAAPEVMQWAYQAHMDMGNNIFDFGKNILQMMENTQLDEVLLNNLKLPYDVFYVNIIDLELPYFSSFFHGFYVLQTTSPENGRDFIEIVFTINEPKSIPISFALDINKPEKISEIIHDRISHELKSWTGGSAALEAIPQAIEHLKKAAYLMLNCLFYLSLPKRDINEHYPVDIPIHLHDSLNTADTKRRKEKAEQAIRQAGYTKIKFVGESFTSIATGMGAGKATHWRRGHWRNHAHGEGMKLRELKWIMPMLINAERGEAVKGHVYDV